MGPDRRQPDIETMRDSARTLLAEGVAPPSPDKLDTLTVVLRGHIHLLIPEVADAAAREPKDSIPKYCALACIGEAHTKLRLDGGGALPVLVLARKLARVVNALCDHYENLNGVRPAAGR
ncbi:DUF6415 family natural product biosynthesis protein [Streptomyces sp. WI04-05B]|uniref:DUF6415 family natural product biosynthesis protein n=1 Tax=Streptomyces TaxID=1883 RepID=UPI0029BA8002|nr:DUF6415 family natural product biosynthesis protein [Streptomyces sp. WI04-05A]MDX2542413.1 DUF6415 family natural product biosynthesis protein [Streptomyces sp. WI04-05B]